MRIRVGGSAPLNYGLSPYLYVVMILLFFSSVFPVGQILQGKARHACGIKNNKEVPFGAIQF